MEENEVITYGILLPVSIILWGHVIATFAEVLAGILEG